MHGLFYDFCYKPRAIGALGNWREERLVSTVRACAAPQVFVGNLETTVILVRVARPCITETRESFTRQDAALFNQAVPYALSKVGKPRMVLRTNN